MSNLEEENQSLKIEIERLNHELDRYFDIGSKRGRIEVRNEIFKALEIYQDNDGHLIVFD